MDDLISRAAALEALGECPYNWNDWPEEIQAVDDWESHKEAIENIPSVDAAPVVHGRWIEYPLCLGYAGAYSDDHIVCSNCKSVWSIMDNDTDSFEHCPNCGAKMDGERRESE